MAEAADDLDVVIDAAALWLAAGRHVALATVIETWGSAPRRAGSHLVIRDDGIFEGSVSGGCVEGDVIVQALELIAAGAAFVAWIMAWLTRRPGRWDLLAAAESPSCYRPSMGHIFRLR
ncbi:XdhC family protein [Rhizorhabdus histidinilytica]